jgi:hypothetical protein
VTEGTIVATNPVLANVRVKPTFVDAALLLDTDAEAVQQLDGKDLTFEGDMMVAMGLLAAALFLQNQHKKPSEEKSSTKLTTKKPPPGWQKRRPPKSCLEWEHQALFVKSLIFPHQTQIRTNGLVLQPSTPGCDWCSVLRMMRKHPGRGGFEGQRYGDSIPFWFDQ